MIEEENYHPIRKCRSHIHMHTNLHTPHPQTNNCLKYYWQSLGCQESSDSIAHLHFNLVYASHSEDSYSKGKYSNYKCITCPHNTMPSIILYTITYGLTSLQKIIACIYIIPGNLLSDIFARPGSVTTTLPWLELCSTSPISISLVLALPASSCALFLRLLTIEPVASSPW